MRGVVDFMVISLLVRGKVLQQPASGLGFLQGSPGFPPTIMLIRLILVTL